ncbi:MAG: metallophosphoesterase [Bacillota bacterium]
MKFVLISDTHIGANPMEYEQQKGYPERLPQIVEALDQWILEQKDIDFVLHSGDMVDLSTEENIRTAHKMFKLSVPVYLCLGNHDLNTIDAVNLWLTHAPDFFPNGKPEFSIQKGKCVMHVVPTQWEETPYFWGSIQAPHFLKEQFSGMRMRNKETETHFICTHCAVMGVPMAQTGFNYEYHNQDEAFEKEVFGIINENPAIRCVLSGHNHINSSVLKNNVRFVTTSSFSEIPFEAKVFSVTDTAIEMETITMLSLAKLNGEYDFNKTYVQGREIDRKF